MRGLVRSSAAAGAAGVVLAALGVLATACGTNGTGVRDEGPGRTSEPVSRPSPAPSPGSKVDAVALLRQDPKVGPDIRENLTPCGGRRYPVDVSYGDLTGGTTSDVLVNVMTCADAVGIGTFVYRYTGGSWVHVFGSEEPPVYSEIDRGDLVVTRQFYGQDDPIASPSGEDVITYRWVGGRFTEQNRTHNDYSNAVGDGQSPPSQS
ncbi:hypothetical protein [Streptomyces physcomitrii]|uniref:Lipoprotein CseA n=1 Tax=Streptomyces physcomitrii TaxID=2724184 RepID=A0ABX1HBD4_9ACTN|nr:hypothetical protein [Streptomyces physcomitrii]NKI44635.1 hypothetical protein [Streptomyces physcomitrii]